MLGVPLCFMILNVLNYYNCSFIKTFYQFVGLCIATCFDWNGHVQAIWCFKKCKQIAVT